ncbi:hypothetical protein JOQ06_026102 [Pogonophryne albipinna]|uniref:Uncharacterized protein n=1 Tax=Pogonophryne albipinna TaxID=1090488 RepID=A0AAD6AEM1_9TELE|nr:hypothetical protein JOQ06_026102 [Pogonophryne albipinna]
MLSRVMPSNVEIKAKDKSGQLIFYERPDTDGPKLSRYSISPTSDPPSLRVVMRPEQTVEDGQKVAEDLMEQLGVSKQSLVRGAYTDLLLALRQTH